MNIAVVIYSLHLSRWRRSGLPLYWKGIHPPICLNASIFVRIIRDPASPREEVSVRFFNESLQIAFPNNILISKLPSPRERLRREGRGEQSLFAFKEAFKNTAWVRRSCFWQGKDCVVIHFKQTMLQTFHEDPKESYKLVENVHPMTPLKKYILLSLLKLF